MFQLTRKSKTSDARSGWLEKCGVLRFARTNHPQIADCGDKKHRRLRRVENDQ